MMTAEWICTNCGSTNRKLVSDASSREMDRCVSCHKKHVIERDVRPVRWKAAAGK